MGRADESNDDIAVGGFVEHALRNGWRRMICEPFAAQLPSVNSALIIWRLAMTLLKDARRRVRLEARNRFVAFRPVKAERAQQECLLQPANPHKDKVKQTPSWSW